MRSETSRLGRRRERQLKQPRRPQRWTRHEFGQRVIDDDSMLSYNRVTGLQWPHQIFCPKTAAFAARLRGLGASIRWSSVSVPSQTYLALRSSFSSSNQPPVHPHPCQSPLQLLRFRVSREPIRSQLLATVWAKPRPKKI